MLSGGDLDTDVGSDTGGAREVMGTMFAPTFTNPSGWPTEVLPNLARAITCEFASVTRLGTPLTVPVTPYLGENSRTLDLSTGLTYPAKAERVRRNPHVALLFSDPLGSGLSDALVVLVQGLGAVRDRDLQANSDRYIELSRRKLPGLYSQLPWFILRRQRWYWTRIWVHVTPLRMLWWPAGRQEEPPRTWEAPAGTVGEVSDPPPMGLTPGGGLAAPRDWRPRAADAARRFGPPVLTVMGADGFPIPVRARGAVLTSAGFHVDLPDGHPGLTAGQGCLTFHIHDATFTFEENAAFVGAVEPADGGVIFRVERALGDLSAPGSWPRRVWAALSAGWRLAPRLRAEAARRGQAPPVIRRP
jgi:hypothetical protein